MDRLKKVNIGLIKKVVALVSMIGCFLLMFTDFISYTSKTSISGGKDAVILSDGVSLFSFLFNGGKSVLDADVGRLRDMFGFSHILMWVVLILTIGSIALFIVGLCMKKNLFVKISSVIFFGAILGLFLMSFDVYEVTKTVKYLDVFTWKYWIMTLFSGLSVGVVCALEEK